MFDYDPLVYAYAQAKRHAVTVCAGGGVVGFLDEHLERRRRLKLAAFSMARRVGSSSPGRRRVRIPPDVLARLDKSLRNYRLDSTFHEEDYIQPPIDVSLYRRRDAPEPEFKLKHDL